MEAERDRGASRRTVLADVVERFLHDPVDGHFDLVGQALGRALELDILPESAPGTRDVGEALRRMRQSVLQLERRKIADQAPDGVRSVLRHLADPL